MPRHDSVIWIRAMSALRDRIQATLYESDLVDLTFAGDLADALLPVVERIARERATKELRSAANDWRKPGRPHRPIPGWLRARAEALVAEVHE